MLLSIPSLAGMDAKQTMVNALAAEAPWWTPGEGHGYAAITYGWLVGELIRRAPELLDKVTPLLDHARAWLENTRDGAPVQQWQALRHELEALQPSADFICLLANTSDDKPHINKSLIMVPMNTPGISVSPPLEKLGMHSSETAQVFFDNVRVPQRNRIGHEGAGFMMQMLQFQEERLFGAANMIKGLEHCIDSTIAYCKERQTFGKALIDNQVIHFRLAELSTEIECLRALVYQATEQYIKGQDVTRLASMAKLKAGRLGREVSDSCLQYWGGMGFMWDNPVARAYRDVRLVSIGGGADEIMLGIICKLMGTLPGKKP